MNSYTLSRQWFSFAYDNPEVKPVHTALYFWIIERANCSGWKKIVDIQTEKSMECLGITDWRTYKNALQFLVDNKLILWLEKSKNQYTCNRISLIEITDEGGDSLKNAYANNAKADAEAIAEAIAEAYPKAHVKAIAEALQSYINPKKEKPLKPETLKPASLALDFGNGNSEESAEAITTTTPELSDFEKFELIRKDYPGTKRGGKTEWEEFKKKFGKEINTDFLRTIWLGLDAKRKTHKELMAAGQFVPEWPHFKTYLNQRRWEEKTEVRETPSPEPKREPSAFKSLQEHFEYWGGTATPTPTTPTPA